MKKKISAKILITQLVILCMTLFIFPMKVKADNVSASLFLYNVHHSYTEHNELIRPFLHQYDFYITANHEVSGRYIISISTRSDATSHTWSSTAGEIYISDVMGAESGCAVEVTGQKDLIVTIKYYTDSPIDILDVRSIQFSQSDLDGNPITTDQSLWSYVQKIEDHEIQLLAQAGFINDQLTDTRQKLTAISNLITTTNSTLSSLLSTATNILTKVTSIDTAIQQIDNTIDTISWTDLSTVTSISNNGNITTAVNKLYTANDIMLFPIQSSQLQEIRDKQSAIYKMIIPIYIYRNDYTVKIGEYRNGSITYKNYNIYKRSTQNSLEIYLYIEKDTKDTFWNPQYISVEIDGSYYFYTDYTNKLQYLYETDIEYWELMGYFNQYNFFQQQKEDNKTIIQKLTELINGNTASNNSVNNNDQSNQQFQQQTQQYDQIESTFQSSFTTDQEAVQQQFNNNSISIFADTTLWFTQQLTALYNASGQMKILFTMPLLLGLALFFIGRGSKVMGVNKLSDSESPPDKNH